MDFRVIKEKELFCLCTPEGDIPSPSTDDFGYGLFLKDTRMLSRFEWNIQPGVWVLLDSDHSQNYEGVFRYTNRAFNQDGNDVPAQTLIATRKQLVDGNWFIEEGAIQNYGRTAVTLSVDYVTDVDFYDMFEVRQYVAMPLERSIAEQIIDNGLEFSYQGLDELFRRTRVQVVVLEESHSIASRTVAASLEKTRYTVGLADEPTLSVGFTVYPGEQVRYAVVVSGSIANRELEDVATELEMTPISVSNLLQGSKLQVSKDYQDWIQKSPRIDGDSDFRQWYLQGLKDLRMLTSDIGYGPFLVAGVPWYSVPFGRDSLITAMQLLPVSREIAKGTLLTMAAFQGKDVNAAKDEEPGKIMHELRAGELTNTGQLPFSPYYGTVDATALFLNLAADYFAWTGDQELIRNLLPSIEMGFNWIEVYGDKDKDGYIEYAKQTDQGFPNQGWKDSEDSTVQKDGTLAKAPIALSEVQGYVYRAYIKWAKLYEQLNFSMLAESCREKAAKLQEKFIADFWNESESVIALALDATKTRVESVTSNMGQVLWSGILPLDIADKVIHRLLKPDMQSGFGIRTLSEDETAYNPLSYHNGSIWPHDNSMIAAGMSLYGRTDASSEVIGCLLESARHFEYRLPELFVGYGKDSVDRPVSYPVSCSPQAWAACVPIYALQVLLGIQPDVYANTMELSPSLPNGILQLEVHGLRLCEGELDVSLHRDPSGITTFRVLKNTTGLSIKNKGDLK